MKELRELKAEVVAVKERVRAPPQAQNPPTQQPMRQTPQCRTCQKSGNGSPCNHCFRCGASGHYVRECIAQFSRRSPAEFSGKRSKVTPMGLGVTGPENQSRYVQCGKQRTAYKPLNRRVTCKTSRYCSKGCQVQHRTVHKPVCVAIQELEKQ